MPRPPRSSTTRRTRRHRRAGRSCSRRASRPITPRSNPGLMSSTFSTDRWPPTGLAGPVSARIFVRTSRPYADLFVRVCDVDGKGVSRNIVDGIRRLSPQTVPAPDVQAGHDGSWRWTWSSTRRPTGCGPGTGSGCRSAEGRSPGSPATWAQQSRSARRPRRCVPVRGLSRLTAPAASCSRSCPRRAASHGRGVTSENLEKQASVCVSAGLDHGHPLASRLRALR